MDRHAEFMALFLRHQHDLRAFVVSVVRDRHRSDDVVQEVSTVLWARFDDFDRSRSFGAWARGIAANAVLKDRDRRRRDPVALTAEAVDALVAAHDRVVAHEPPDQAAALLRCIDALPEPSRRLVEWRYGEGLAIAAIAQRAGAGGDAIKQALSRLRRRLQDCIERRLRREGAA